MSSEIISAKDSSQRLNWLDIAKAFGIFAIVLGHSIQGGNIKKYVYSFHVPMFFFLQGISFSVAGMEKRPFSPFLSKRAKSMLIPYYSFSAISTLAILVASMFVSLPAKANISPSSQLLWEVLSGYCDANRPLWFIPCSFCVSIFGYGIIKLSNRFTTLKSRKVCFLAIVAAAGCILLYINDSYFHIYNLFWKADTAIEMIPFFILGYITMEYKCIESIFALSRIKKLFLCMALIATGGLLGIWNDEVGYLGNYYGNISVFYGSALISILGYILAAELLPPIKAFRYVGKRTLSILLIHKFPLIVFQYLIPFTRRMLQQYSLLTGVFVSLIAIVVGCVGQEVFHHFCPVLVGESGTGT